MRTRISEFGECLWSSSGLRSRPGPARPPSSGRRRPSTCGSSSRPISTSATRPGRAGPCQVSRSHGRQRHGGHRQESHVAFRAAFLLDASRLAADPHHRRATDAGPPGQGRRGPQGRLAGRACLALQPAHGIAGHRGPRPRTAFFLADRPRSGQAAADRGEDDRRALPLVDHADAAAPRRHPFPAPGLQRGLAVSAGAAAFLVGRARRLADPLCLHARLWLAAHARPAAGRQRTTWP